MKQNMTPFVLKTIAKCRVWIIWLYIRTIKQSTTVTRKRIHAYIAKSLFLAIIQTDVCFVGHVQWKKESNSVLSWSVIVVCLSLSSLKKHDMKHEVSCNFMSIQFAHRYSDAIYIFRVNVEHADKASAHSFSQGHVASHMLCSVQSRPNHEPQQQLCTYKHWPVNVKNKNTLIFFYTSNTVQS